MLVSTEPSTGHLTPALSMTQVKYLSLQSYTVQFDQYCIHLNTNFDPFASLYYICNLYSATVLALDDVKLLIKHVLKIVASYSAKNDSNSFPELFTSPYSHVVPSHYSIDHQSVLYPQHMY